MASQVMRITLKAYDHKLIDQAAKQIIETIKSTGAKVSGPVPMPTKVEKITILRAVHKYKDSREQFEQRTHKRPANKKGKGRIVIEFSNLDQLEGIVRKIQK